VNRIISGASWRYVDHGVFDRHRACAILKQVSRFLIAVLKKKTFSTTVLSTTLAGGCSKRLSGVDGVETLP